MNDREVTNNVVYAGEALKDLDSLDNSVRPHIVAWIDKNLYHSVNPRRNGEELSGPYKGIMKYHVRKDYRVCVKFYPNVILIVAIRHRKKSYKTKK